MELVLLAAVALVSFANGANDNFKGVATLWGAGHTTYHRALAWATGFTLLGSLLAVWLAGGLVAKFNGSALLAAEIYLQIPFVAAVALGAGATVLLAARLGIPISTTHALTGALVGAGIVSAGFSGVKFAALGSGVIAPLLFSPIVALLMTLGIFTLANRFVPGASATDCVCVDEAQPVALAPAGVSAAVAVAALPSVRVAKEAECSTGAETVKFTVSGALHWLSGAAISFARGVNDTPKITALLLASGAAAVALDYALVAVAMAVGGVLGAARVARTMSKKITPMDTREAVTANLVAAALVLAASRFALPVSTTHVTSGAIFGIGALRSGEADWGRVREILLSWVATLPLGAALAGFAYWLLV